MDVVSELELLLDERDFLLEARPSLAVDARQNAWMQKVYKFIVDRGRELVEKARQPDQS